MPTIESKHTWYLIFKIKIFTYPKNVRCIHINFYSSLIAFLSFMMMIKISEGKQCNFNFIWFFTNLKPKLNNVWKCWSSEKLTWIRKWEKNVCERKCMSKFSGRENMREENKRKTSTARENVEQHWQL